MVEFIFKLSIILFFSHYVEGFWIVQTQVGMFKGYEAPDGNYYQFLGIPYGMVYAEYPYADAVPYPPSSVMYDAKDDTFICPQSTVKQDSSMVGFGTLDCLRINIYVPYSVAKTKNLPVLVWLFGGKFSYGAASRNMYGPRYLVRHDVIVVAISSRLGPYGYICMRTPEFPGNEGLKDQVLAFRWIKKNIAAFGGDPDSITVMGESSGAKAADLHLYSNNELLFHRMILQGGSALTLPTDLRRNEFETLQKMVMKLGPQANYSVDQMLNAIKNENPAAVATVSDKLEVGFIPCAEDRNNSIRTFLTENPINLKIPKVQNMSILIGYNADDQSHEHLFSEDPFMYENWRGFVIRLNASFSVTPDILSEMVKVVIKYYIGEERVTYAHRFQIRKFETDFRMAHPTQRAIDKYLENGAKKVYQYVFSYLGGRNSKRITANANEFGAVHTDEVGYLFDLPFFIGMGNPAPRDQLIIDRMTTMWTNFAKFEDPTPTVSNILPYRWTPITRKTPHYYMNIDTNMYMSNSPFHSRMAFWDLFYSNYWEYEAGLREGS